MFSETLAIDVNHQDLYLIPTPFLQLLELLRRPPWLVD
jgi:hypothetical protein